MGDVLVKAPGKSNRKVVVLGTVFQVELLEDGDIEVSYEAEGAGRSDKYQTIKRSDSLGITILRLVTSPHKEELEFLPPNKTFPGGIEYQMAKEHFNTGVTAAAGSSSAATGGGVSAASGGGGVSAAAGGGGSKSRRTRRRRNRRSTRRRRYTRR